MVKKRKSPAAANLATPRYRMRVIRDKRQKLRDKASRSD
jgi:hypothetical protein